MAKPKKPQFKTKVIFVRVSVDDHEQIEKDAERAGVPMAELARIRIVKRRRRAA